MGEVAECSYRVKEAGRVYPVHAIMEVAALARSGQQTVACRITGG
jgi:hypothetical protein